MVYLSFIRSKDMLFFSLMRLLTRIITKSWLNAATGKEIENWLIKYGKTKKSSSLQAKILKYGTFQIQESAFPWWESNPAPLENLGGLTWKGAHLISKFSKPPYHFWNPKSTTPLRAMAWCGRFQWAINGNIYFYIYICIWHTSSMSS